MNTQTEAQRLIEWIEGDMSCAGDKEVVAELRRLEAQTINQADWRVEWQKWEAEAKRLEAANAELLAALKMSAQALSWLAFGECRGFTDNLPTALEATGAASAAIKKHGGAA